MATTGMDRVIRQLREAVLRQDGAGWTDGQLLASFIDKKDEAAFAALIQRHGPMVFGVCRRIAADYHDAEDAFQATFLVLACKASSIRPRENVGNWLHGVALRTARKAKAVTAKRRGREMQVTEMPESEAGPQEQCRDMQPLLDKELNGLPEKYRLPILLCDLEGKTIKGAAQQLGWLQGTLAGRLARGRKLLAKRLASRGVVLSAGWLTAVVSQSAASADVATSLIISTVKAAKMIAGGQEKVAGAVPAKVIILMEGALQGMLFNRLKLTVIVMLLAVAVAGTGLLTFSTSTAAQREDKMYLLQNETPKSDPPKQAPIVGAKEGEQEAAKDNVNLPRGTAPLQALVKLSADKRFISVQTRSCLYEPVIHFVNGKQVTAFNRKELVLSRVYNCDAVEVYDTKGKKIEVKQLPSLLLGETAALVMDEGKRVDPLHLRLLKDDILLFVLPATVSVPPQAEEGPKEVENPGKKQ
jgi:RNA polymerase sigma factor (sigma-70 family)